MNSFPQSEDAHFVGVAAKVYMDERGTTAYMYIVSNHVKQFSDDEFGILLTDYSDEKYEKIRELMTQIAEICNQ